MTLTAGTRLGPYEIVALLGAGGMGEVYRARDVRLERSVAIKALPKAFASDPDRLGRFEREAKLLASLNHPNIAGIHGLEEVGGAPYLVLEFVEGETLSQRLARGPLSVREALEIGGQIASAIEAAHERGIVHRDLKPGNVMLTPSRAVKVLDFGLAKGTLGESPSSPDFSVTPTLAMGATGDGIILGTAPYMSPEQARGKGVDRRTDVWAFGCVLFECVTGRPPFAGETVSDVIARILERDPDWSALPATLPPRLRDLVRRCLTKDVAERPRDIGDLRLELAAILAEISAPTSGIGSAATTTPSLAVLYFENLASDSESEYFCSGITEDILTDLSKIRGLKVASRNAVARYRGAAVDISRVAAELGVKAVLEGSVRRAGDRVRISAQLINAADGFHLWAERYDRTLQDVFAVQEEIASSIAEALRVALSPAESQNLVQGRPADARAYDLYLKGRERYGSYTQESLREALSLFRQATEIDANYALAWAGIADCYGQLLQWGVGDAEEQSRLGLEAARRAIALDSRLAEGHKAEGLVLRFAGDREGSRAALLRAVEANPRFTPALINLAVEAFCLSDLAGNERYLRRALEIDPQDAFATTWLAWITTLTRRGDEAIAVARRLRILSKDAFYLTALHSIPAEVHMHRGDLDAAEREIQEGLAAGAAPNALRALQTGIDARRGRTEDVRRALRELWDLPIQGGGILATLAGAAVMIGDTASALHYLERNVIRDLAPTLARLEPALHPLLDQEPYAPRRRDCALVWPLEAPMMDAATYALFREVRVESGIPQASDARPR